MKTQLLFFGLLCLMLLSCVRVQAQLSPSPSRKERIPDTKPEKNSRDITPEDSDALVAVAGDVRISVLSLTGDKLRRSLTLTLLFEHNRKGDIRITGQSAVAVDDLSNQLRPGMLALQSLVSGVPTKETFVINQAVAEASSLKIVKFSARMYNLATRQSEVYPVEFRDIAIKWN
ncbi:hypothetical protein [Dyadobacter diqingensis]|uniref:hypothetical protein n=1 Tax=Dyadobacter diqingensis TaxID=2938121 RepID=UPI0020C1B79C|nr:hypothetical protein [Dyadobacter diqingensis]